MKKWCITVVLAALLAGCAGTKPPPQAAPVYRDGTYTGQWDKWPEMKVSVTLENNQIVAVKIIENNSSSGYAQRIEEALPARIQEAGRVDVEGVSGATMSSNSLKNAVNTALEKAKVKQD